MSISPHALSLSTASTISAADRPNFEKSPPDCSQRPAPRDDSRARMPSDGLIFTRSLTRWMLSSSVGFSTTRMTVLPIFDASSAVSMYSSSL